MEPATRILHLEDDPADRELVRTMLEASLVVCLTWVRTREDYEQALARERYDLILADYRLPVYDGMSALRRAQQVCPDVPFLFVSGTMGEEAAIEGLTQGATDYVLKDRLSRLVPAVTRALQEVENRRERRRAEDALRTLSRAVEQSPASIIVTDTNGRIEYVNPKFTQATGYDLAEVLGKTPRILKSGEMPAQEYQRLWTTVAAGKEWRGEFHNRKKNGELYWELASISPIFDESGRITHYLAVKEDISEYKRLQDDLRQAQKMEAFGQLAGGVAHDFNNLLTVIQVDSALLQATTLTDEQAGEVEEIAAAAARAANLTRQLLTFSRRQAAVPRDLDLNEVVANLTKMLQRMIGERISLTARYAPGKARIHADPGMLEQALMNLAINSRDAMPKGGQVSISTDVVTMDEDASRANPEARPGTFVRLSVSDTGHGIPHEILPRIFEPFFTTKAAGQGTGLGLAIVFGIVQQHQGWIDTESEVGVGTTFRLFLPLAKGPAPVAPEAGSDFPELRGTETILLVEDEPTVRSAIRRVIERHGYRVFEAGTAVEAMRVWADRRGAIDLLLTDLVMPDEMTGRDLAERLLAQQPRLRVLYSSGYSDETLADGAALRASPDFIEKPYLPQDVLRKIRERLGRP